MQPSTRVIITQLFLILDILLMGKSRPKVLLKIIDGPHILSYKTHIKGSVGWSDGFGRVSCRASQVRALVCP